MDRDTRVPLPVQQIRTHRPCFLFNGLICTSSVLFPVNGLGRTSSRPVSCSLDWNTRILLLFSGLRTYEFRFLFNGLGHTRHKSCFPFNGSECTSPFLFPGSMGEDARVLVPAQWVKTRRESRDSRFLLNGFGHIGPASRSMD